MSLVEGFQGLFSQAVVGAVRLVLLSTLAHLPYQYEADSLPQDVYDFVVVGAGAGGCVVAARLSETGASVLLLEAGPSEPPEAAVPSMAPLLYAGDRDWRIKGKPQRNAQMGYKGNSSYLISGRTMGGSTSINGMVYTRGNRRDFDRWASIGNPGWDYASVLPYFKKSENFRGHRTPYTDRFHSSGGPLTVDDKSHNSDILKAAANAGLELGYKVIDESGPSQIGFAPAHGTIRDGVRVSASEAFVRPAKDRKNLRVQPGATVTRIIFNGDKRAVGVEYTLKGEKRTVVVKKEVVVSAGALFTPKLLLLSGVGPAQHLKDMGIPVVSPLEGVGHNFGDHPTVYLTFQVKRGTSTSLRELTGPGAFLQYIRDQTGFHAALPALEMNAWLNLGGDDPEWPDTQLLLRSMSFGLDGGGTMSRALGFNREIFNNIYGPLVGRESLDIGIFLGRPKSRGSISLLSSDPADPPVIDTNFFSHPDDIKLLVKAIRMAFKIVNTRSIQEALEAKYLPNVLKPCEQYGNYTDAYWECYARYTVSTMWHYSGTAKMAPHTDPQAVVSPRLRVHGVSGLRVVDASVMPQGVVCNNMAATYMIAEKGADIIKQDWGYPIDPLPE